MRRQSLASHAKLNNWVHLICEARHNDHQLVVFVAGLMEPVGGDPTDPNNEASDAERYALLAEVKVFASWLASRLAGSNVIFSPGFDSPPGTNEGTPLVSLIKGVGAEARAAVPRHLFTNHWSSQAWLTNTTRCNGNETSALGMDDLQAETWHGFHMFQSGAICDGLSHSLGTGEDSVTRSRLAAEQDQHQW